MVLFTQGYYKKDFFNVNFVLIFYNLSIKQVHYFQLTLFLCQKNRNFTY